MKKKKKKEKKRNEIIVLNLNINLANILGKNSQKLFKSSKAIFLKHNTKGEEEGEEEEREEFKEEEVEKGEGEEIIETPRKEFSSPEGAGWLSSSSQPNKKKERKKIF